MANRSKQNNEKQRETEAATERQQILNENAARSLGFFKARSESIEAAFNALCKDAAEADIYSGSDASAIRIYHLAKAGLEKKNREGNTDG